MINTDTEVAPAILAGLALDLQDISLAGSRPRTELGGGDAGTKPSSETKESRSYTIPADTPEPGKSVVDVSVCKFLIKILFDHGAFQCVWDVFLIKICQKLQLILPG